MPLIGLMSALETRGNVTLATVVLKAVWVVEVVLIWSNKLQQHRGMPGTNRHMETCRTFLKSN